MADMTQICNANRCSAYAKWHIEFTNVTHMSPRYYCDEHVEERTDEWMSVGYNCSVKPIDGDGGLVVPVVDSKRQSMSSTVVTGLTGDRVRVTPTGVWHPSVGTGIVQGSMKYGVNISVNTGSNGVFYDAFLDIEALNDLLVALVEGRMAVEGLEV